MDRLGGLVVLEPEHRAGDPGSNPGPGENFFLKLLIIRNNSLSVMNGKSIQSPLSPKSSIGHPQRVSIGSNFVPTFQYHFLVCYPV